jgi:hypothetical protein
MPIYMCAVDKLLCEFILDSFVYSDANPDNPLSSLPLSLSQPSMLFLVHEANEITQNKPPMT